MIDLYTDATPNGWKASVTLEEIGMEYTTHHVDITTGAQKEDWYRELCPNARIPAIVDRANGDFPVFESGAIMLYLAKKSGKLLPGDDKGESRVTQWLMFQMGGIGPMMGQSNVFYRYFPEKIPAAIERYHNECRRLYEVLDRQLDGRDYLCDEFSLADIANWCWVRIYFWGGSSIDGLDNLEAWIDRMEARPACQRGVSVHHDVGQMQTRNFNLTFPLCDALFGTSDLDRSVIGTLFNGEDESHVRADRRYTPPPREFFGDLDADEATESS